MGREQTYPIYVIAGQDQYRRAEALKQLKHQLQGAGPELGLAVYDGKTADVANVFDELQTLPFLSSHRPVIVDAADPFISQNRDRLERYFDQPASTGVLILVCDTWRKNTKLAKKLPKVGKLISV